MHVQKIDRISHDWSTQFRKKAHFALQALESN